MLATFSLKLSPACAFSALILWGNAGRTPFVFVTLLLLTYPDELTRRAFEFAVELRPADEGARPSDLSLPLPPKRLLPSLLLLRLLIGVSVTSTNVERSLSAYLILLRFLHFAYASVKMTVFVN
ncbi:MAG: hypothetical protein K2O95_06610 [Clostridia bacterium]|nr:hypothetical protein [Clostridia bacterium]